MKYGRESEMSIRKKVAFGMHTHKCKWADWANECVCVREIFVCSIYSKCFRAYNITANLVNCISFHDECEMFGKICKLARRGRTLHTPTAEAVVNPFKFIHDVIAVGECARALMLPGVRKIVLSSMGAIPCWLVDLCVRLILVPLCLCMHIICNWKFTGANYA